MNCLHQTPCRRKKGVSWLIALSLLLQSDRLFATTYCVSPAGSDSNPGTQSQPWLTIQKAANTMIAGDTALVQAGNYTEGRIVTVNAGTLANPITFRADGTVAMNGWLVLHSYIVVDGFEITGVLSNVPAAQGAVTLNNAVGSKILNNYIHDLSNSIMGVDFISAFATNCLVANNRIIRPSNRCLLLAGSSHVVSNNWLEAPPDDAIRCFGDGHIICDNILTNLNATGAGHPDLIQSFSSTGLACSNIVFERNLAVDCGAQICQITDDGSNSNVMNWTFRNNVFIRMAAGANCNFPGAHWYNNTFYRCTTNTQHVLLFQVSIDRGSSWGAEILNNAFIECGPGLGTDPTRGWYLAATNLPDLVADYNYVGGTNGAAKNTVCPLTDTLKFCEAHGVNGGNPSFVNPGSDFHLLSGSVLIDAGTTLADFADDFDGTSRPQGAAWDIGAFEFDAGQQASNQPPVIVTAPTVTNRVLQVGNLTVVMDAETNVFSVGATDLSGVLYYTWMFGDGASSGRSQNNTSSHIYTNCGSYTATVTVDDGTNSTSAGFTVSVACLLEITKLQAKLNFAKTNSDSCTVRGRFDLPANYNFAGRLATLNIGGAEVSFTLDSKGSGRNGSSTFKRPTYNGKTGLWSFNAKLRNGSWQTAWADFGIINSDIAKPGVIVTNLPVILVSDIEAFIGGTNLHYTAKQGKSGIAK